MTTRLLLLAALLLSGCGDTVVDPFLRGAAPYSMYGLIVADLGTRVQRVRVQRVRVRVDPPTEPEDATAQVNGQLRSPDPRTQAELLWSPRTVVYDDGTAGVVFERSFQAVPDSRMTLTYEDIDGRTAEAEVVFPPIPTGTPEPSVDVGVGDGRRVTQRIAWDAARLGETVEVVYRGANLAGDLVGIEVTYGREAYDETGTAIVLNLLRDIRALSAVTGVDEAGQIRNLQARMVVTALSDVLPGVGEIPRDDLGRAFVAGGTAGRLFWRPDIRL